MSVKLSKVCKRSKSKTMISDVCHQKLQGIQTCVEQLEDKMKNLMLRFVVHLKFISLRIMYYAGILLLVCL